MKAYLIYFKLKLLQELQIHFFKNILYIFVKFYLLKLETTNYDKKFVSFVR